MVSFRRSRHDPDGAARKRIEDALERLSSPDGHLVDRDEAVTAYTDSLRMMKRAAAVLDGVGDGVFICDGAGEIRSWNRAAERILDRPSKRSIGHPCSDVLKLLHAGEPIDCSRGCALLGLVRDRTQGSSIEVVRPRAGARDQELQIGVFVVECPGGEIDEVVHTVRDVGAIKHADEAKTMFLATASHELKTPLTVILGYIQALRDGWVDAGDRDLAIDSIESRAKQLSGIVDRLLMTGRIEGGRIDLDMAPVELGGLIHDRADSFAGATGRSIAYDIEENLPNVMADQEALATVLDHLIDNAIKYSPDGGDIGVRATEGNGHVAIAIADPGIGMSADEAAHCFDRFWQAESTDVRRFGGTGIGLYIVRSLVESMGGRISVKSSPGEGTTFIVALRGTTQQGETPKAPEGPGVGRATMIQEFMRQIGVPQGGGGS